MLAVEKEAFLMASTESQKKASIKWQKENYSRIPLDVPKEYHEKLKAIAKSNGMTLGGYIKQAIAEKMEREE
jgi:predicted HicB family RNase H-like nuclease